MKRTTVSERALVLASVGRDAPIASGILREAGIAADICRSLDHLVTELNSGAALAVITEEALASADLGALSTWLDDQEEWSDLPFVLLTRSGGGLERNPAAKRYLDILGNVNFLERPFHPTTLVSLAHSALRSRRRQYEARSRLQALHESEERYRSLFENIDEGFCVIEFLDGPDGPLSDYIHIQANAAYARHAGIPNVVGQKVREMVPSEAEGWVKTYGEVLRTGEPIRFERELLATGHHLELAAFRIEPPSRRQVAVLFQDVTSRRTAERALRESEAQFRAFAQAVPNHVWAARPDGNIYWFNDQVLTYTGGSSEELIDRGWEGVVHPEDLPTVAEAWAQSLATGRPYEIEFRILSRSGTYRWFLVRAEPVRSPNGSIVNWVGTNTDIDNARRQAAELSSLNSSLEQQVKARTAELMATEEVLRQSQKMEASGSLPEAWRTISTTFWPAFPAVST